MTITAQKVITIDYVLKDDAGETIDTSQDGSFCYLHGANNIIPGLEQALEGRGKGESLSLVIAPEDAYGQYVPEMSQVVNRNMFEEGSDIEVGMQFHAQDHEGRVIAITVSEINGDDITIDGNHPLAGITLHYDVTVIDIRDATDEELSHGHVHMHGHEHGDSCQH